MQLTHPLLALGIVLLLVSAPGLRAVTTQEPALAKVSPDAQFLVLKTGFDKAMQDIQKELSKAKTAAERSTLLAEKYPKPEAYIASALAIAEQSPKTPAAAACLVWALPLAADLDHDNIEELVLGVRDTSSVPLGLQKSGSNSIAEILNTLLQDHINDELLGDACRAISGANDTTLAENFVSKVKDQSPHHAVKGNACYTLAKMYLQRAELAQKLQAGDDAQLKTRLQKMHGDAWLDAMSSCDITAMHKKGEDLLEAVESNYGDVKTRTGTLADAAKHDLFEIRNLTIGKHAPEIVGQDLDGKTFQLSDYRGKVVFLDFWGFW
ncbi:hypothetical protein LBMAG49_23200 [Planctomycetota bacterium]|nr:hypothetical protein LBMAG49_23200 [Planctomycetota bacterium]